MTTRPDELDPSAATLLNDGAYPESQVSYEGATYWLERSADGAKRLVAVADDESAFRGFAGSYGADQWPGSARRRHHAGECPGAPVGAALADAVPVRTAYLRSASATGSDWRHPVMYGH
jgi:hypothetical protein